MVFVEQIEALLDFLQVRPDLALGNMSRTKEGRSLAKHLWIECAQILNSVSSTCPQKTPENWRMFYNEYKSKLFKKVKARKEDLNHSGSSPAKASLLTPLQKRLYLMLGLDFGEPLLGGTYDPLYQDSENGVGEDSSFNCNTYNTISTDNGMVKPKVESEKRKLVSEIIYDDQVSPSPSPTNADQSQSVPLEDDQPRRRRRLRHSVKREQSTDQEQTLYEALERLKRIESATGKAIQKQARATNRLAAAIERISDRLSKPLTVLVKESSRKKKKYCRIVMSSASSESDDSSSASSDDRAIVLPTKTKSSRDYRKTSRESSIK